MNKVKNIFLSVLAVGCMSSCDDDKFLEHDNLYEALDNNYYRNVDEMNQALAAAYACLPTDGGRENPTLIANLMSDDCFGAGGPDDVDAQATDNFQNNAENKYGELWGVLYKGIFRTNMIISRFGQAAIDDPQQANQMLGEAHFLRAFFYLRLAQFFGSAPLITTPEPTNNPKASADELFGQIAADLKLAIEIMPDTKYGALSADRLGHATKWAAEGMMARAFLFYTGYYKKSSISLPDGGVVTKQNVIDWVDDCIANSGHDLLPDFRNQWPYSYANQDYKYAVDNSLTWVDENGANNETMFAAKYSVYGENTGDGTLSYSNQLVLYMAMRGQDGIVPFGMGWGFGSVNPQLFNSYEAGDVRKNGSIIDVQDPNEGQVSTDYVWGQWDCLQETGYWQKKYTPIQVPMEDGTLKGMFFQLYGAPDDFQTWNMQDEILLRFADVLLMGAELGSSNAQVYFDRVRMRAGLGSKPVSLEAIKEERRHELAFEGLRYFDLLRWGDAETAINAADGMTVKNSNEDATYNVSFRPETGGFLPIPESQISLSEGVLTQNPGW